MTRKNVYYYVSGHGFGHATRSCVVMNALHAVDPSVFFHIRSNAPRWLFAKNVVAPFEYCFVEVDVGVVQRTIFNIDKMRTLRNCEEALDRGPRVLKQELKFGQANPPHLILSDIAPIAFDVGHKLGVPAVGIANFSWDWIYQGYVKEMKPFAQIVSAVRESYARAELLLKLPFSGEFPAFRKTKNIGLVARRSSADRAETFEALGIPRTNKKVVLLAFGGVDGAGFMIDGIERNPQCLFVIPTDQALPRLPNAVKVPEVVHVRFQDLVKACDLVVSKPGYGIVSECVANRTPFLYTSRDDFVEYDVMVRQMPKMMPCAFIPRMYLVMGDWDIHLEGVFGQKTVWKDGKTDGADDAARILKKYLK
jgi:L-arabinokinase